MADATRLVGATVHTGDPSAAPILDGEVAFDRHGVITWVGPSRGPAGTGDVDVSGHVLMPGLVNSHTHSAMTLLRGTCDDENLHTWLGQVQAVEQKFTHDDVLAGLRLSLVEMIRSGTTAFADMYHWDETLLDAVLDSGMRVVAAHSMFDFDSVGFASVSAMTGRQALDHAEMLASAFEGEDRIHIRYGPHAVYTCSPEMLSEVARRADRHELGVHIHLSESAAEVEQCRARHGVTPIALAARHKVFEVPTLVAHAVHATPADIELLAVHETAVAHNPVSNMKLGSGIAPLPELLAAGLTVGLGTDGAASNNSLDMFEEIRAAAIIHRGLRQQPDVIRSGQVLDMATARGAAAVGFPEAGLLAPGRWADVIAVTTRVAHATPVLSPASFLTFAARGSDVNHVYVGGQCLMSDGILTTLDETAVRERANEAGQRLHRPSPAETHLG